nr:DEAD/DEAH box helicase [Marinicella sp. W31]MDC2878114.1 DEAD/DEAH box helicase [Marinicella sp. W31]
MNQIAENLRVFARKTPLKVNIVVGGASINRQQHQLSGGTDILVATPGRLLDLLDRRALRLDAVRFLVLDEADQMLDLGFIHDLKKISSLVPDQRQTMLFSATMPKSIADLSRNFLTNPERVEVSAPGKTADKVDQAVHFVAGKADKVELLRKELTSHPEGRAIVFLRTKHGAEKLMKHLESRGFATASIHGNKSQGQRERALKSFKTGEINVLVATDVAARGIDVPGVTHVYNYDLPEVADAYVHRIGRTARAGKDGKAVAFCTPEESGLLRDIQRLTGIDIAVASGEPHAHADRPARNGGGRGRGGNPSGKPARRARPSGNNGAPRHAGEARDGANRNGPAKSRPRRQRPRQGDRRQSA